MLCVSDLTIKAGERKILDGFSCNALAGDSIALMGPSGCGKSTALKAVAGLIPHFMAGQVSNEGIIWQDSQHQFFSARARSTALVFQDLAIWPHLCVRAQLDLVKPKENKEITVSTEEIIQELSLANLAEANARNLSGGEKQRLAIGRALRALPSILLLDEPFNALDEGRKLQTINFLLKIQRRYGLTIIFSTHDRGDASLLKAKILPFRT